MCLRSSQLAHSLHQPSFICDSIPFASLNISFFYFCLLRLTIFSPLNSWGSLFTFFIFFFTSYILSTYSLIFTYTFCFSIYKLARTPHVFASSSKSPLVRSSRTHKRATPTSRSKNKRDEPRSPRPRQNFLFFFFFFILFLFYYFLRIVRPWFRSFMATSLPGSIKTKHIFISPHAKVNYC